MLYLCMIGMGSYSELSTYKFHIIFLYVPGEDRRCVAFWSYLSDVKGIYNPSQFTSTFNFKPQCNHGPRANHAWPLSRGIYLTIMQPLQPPQRKSSKPKEHKGLFWSRLPISFLSGPILILSLQWEMGNQASGRQNIYINI